MKVRGDFLRPPHGTNNTVVSTKTENKLSKGQHRSGNASPNNTQIADKTRHGDKQHKPQPTQNLDTPWWAPIAQHEKGDGAGGSPNHINYQTKRNRTTDITL